MRVVSVSGIRGGGKTSLIRGLTELSTGKGLKTAVIVNEDGDVSYDDEFIRRNDLEMRFIRGG